MGEFGLHCECIPDPGQQKKDLLAILDAPQKMMGRACPRGVTPPRRINEPPPMPPEELAAALSAAGVSPAYCEKAPELQRLILEAAVAMKEGDAARALRQQQAAGELASALGVFDVAVLCRIALGSYLIAAGRRDEALLSLRDAAALAHKHGFALQKAQAHLGIGLLLCLAKRYVESAEAYEASARCAETAKVPVLAIEAWRMAGQVSLQAHDFDKASFAFREAVLVAEKSEVDTVKDSTAAESARKLAEIYDRLGMPDQARSLQAEAEAMERGEIGVSDPVLSEI
jgi:tetratricopeptide (TPR) repeat protein